MDIYVGKTKCKLVINGAPYQLMVGAPTNTVIPQTSVRLKSSDAYVLTDKDGIYLVPKEEE